MDIHHTGHCAPEEGAGKGSLLKFLLVPAGLILAVWLIWRLGPGRVWSELSGGWWPAFAGVVGAYILQQSLGTFALWLLGTRPSASGWRYTPIFSLARVRYVGEVLNYAMPTGGVGGEPYKLLTLSRSEGTNPAFRALAAAKFLHVAAVGPFAATVFFSAAAKGMGGEQWHRSLIYTATALLIVTIALWSVVLWSFVGRLLIGGYFRIRFRVPKKLRGLRRFLHIDIAAAKEIKRAPLRTAVAYACYLGMWFAASLEWLAIARVLGTSAEGLSLTGAGMFECATIIVAAAVPVPAGMGTQEAGKAAIAVMLGMAPPVGVAMSLIRRGREILMVIAGVVLGLLEWGRKKR